MCNTSGLGVVESKHLASKLETIELTNNHKLEFLNTDLENVVSGEVELSFSYSFLTNPV